MRREAFKMYLKPGCEEEYKKRHAQLWPEMKKMLAEQGVRNYSIFWDKETNMLFGYQEVEGDGGSQDCGENPICKKWWEFMDDIMATHPDHSPISVPLIERFHLD